MKPYTIAVVGIGPGDRESMTLKALHTIEAADTIVGYSTYLKLIEDLLEGKEVVQSGMTEEIQRCEEAIALALQGKQVAVVANPGSRSRKDCLPRAAEIFLEARKADTLCAITRNIGRKGESKELLTLGELKSREVDMRTTVFIGAEDSMELNGYLLTPRGYDKKRKG